MEDKLNQAFAGDLDKEGYEALFEEFRASHSLRAEARESCFKQLVDDAKHTRARLILARLFYLDEYGEFCVRELLELKKYTDLDSIDRLIESIGNFARTFISKPIEKVTEAKEKVKKEAKPKDKPIFQPTSGAFGAIVEDNLSEDEDEDFYEDEGEDIVEEEDLATVAEELKALAGGDEEEVVAEMDFTSGFFDVLDNLDED